MLADGTLRLKALRGLNIKADRKAFLHYATMTFGAWKSFNSMTANLEKYYTRWYLLKVCKKCIGEPWENKTRQMLVQRKVKRLLSS